MMKFLDSLAGMDAVFFFCFAAGGLVFLIWTVIQFVAGGHGGHGGGFDAGVDAGGAHMDFGGHADLGGHGGDVSGHEGVSGHGSAESGVGADLSFQILSFQGLGAFGLMFGVTGLALHREMNLAAPVATVGALIAGMMAIWVLDRLMHALSRLQSSGTIVLQNAIGEQGTVYLHIPAGGTGKATVPIQGRLMTMDAVSEDKEEIKTQERVEVVNVTSGMLVVRKL